MSTGGWSSPSAGAVHLGGGGLLRPGALSFVLCVLAEWCLGGAILLGSRWRERARRSALPRPSRGVCCSWSRALLAVVAQTLQTSHRGTGDRKMAVAIALECHRCPRRSCRRTPLSRTPLSRSCRRSRPRSSRHVSRERAAEPLSPVAATATAEPSPPPRWREFCGVRPALHRGGLLTKWTTAHGHRLGKDCL